MGGVVALRYGGQLPDRQDKNESAFVFEPEPGAGLCFFDLVCSNLDTAMEGEGIQGVAGQFNSIRLNVTYGSPSGWERRKF